jgi:dipeptidyl aminopeptidase/acylaminoacyl peptidase
MIKLCGVLALAGLASLACGTAGAAAPTLHLADLRKLVGISSPEISPNGAYVVARVRRGDYEKDRYVGDLVLIDVASHAARTLVRDGHVQRYAWSPEGDAIAYIAEPKSGDDASPQLFVLPMNGGEPLQLTHEKKGVDDFEWRPDGRALAYSAEIESPNAKALEHREDAFNVTEEAWTAQSSPEPSYLYEVARAGGSRHRIGHGSWSVGGGFTYAAGGAGIFVTRIKPGASENQYLAREIVRVDVKTGAASALPALSIMQTDPLRSRDGRSIAFAFANPLGTMQTEVAIAGPNGEHPHMVTQHLDRNVDTASFDPGGALVLGADDATTRRFFRVAPDGTVTRHDLGNVYPLASASIARDGTIAFTGGTPTHPSEVYILAPHARAPQAITHYNDWIRGYALGASRTVSWRSSDGFTPDGVLVSPPHLRAGARYPLALVIHGGPTAASPTAFSGFAQILAAHGWFVFEPNYRGSDNMGLAFARTTVPHIASVPGRDIEEGLAAVLASNPIDPSRIAVSGWSEGGLMTSWLITHDTRWKAAVSGAAVNEWVGYAAMTDAKDFTPQFIGSSPWTNAALFSTYESESPLTYADKVKTPTLILSDAGDFRVPTPLAYEFYHEIRATGTPVQFVVWPVTAHFPGDPVRIEDVYRHWQDWLVKYL